MLACVYNVKKKNGLFANIDCLFVCFVIRMQIYVKRLFIVCATYHSAGHHHVLGWVVALY